MPDGREGLRLGLQSVTKNPHASWSSALAGADRLDPSLRELLDYVAVELAHEYIRLMETAADDE